MRSGASCVSFIIRFANTLLSHTGPADTGLDLTRERAALFPRLADAFVTCSSPEEMGRAKAGFKRLSRGVDRVSMTRSLSHHLHIP
jgi:hypothetical protein